LSLGRDAASSTEDSAGASQCEKDERTLLRSGGGLLPHPRDVGADMDVDGADLLVWQRQLGSTTAVAATNAVPEKASGLLRLVAGVGASVKKMAT
jgi:hypothetical protein